MIGIVVVANGNIGREYLANLEQMRGEQTGIVAVSVESDHDRRKKTEEICNAAKKVDSGDGVIVVTDLIGSSPTNISIEACMPGRHEILSGLNMPMLIALSQARSCNIESAARRAVEVGRKYILCVQAKA